MIIIFFFREGGTDLKLVLVLESLVRNLAHKVNYCVSLSVSKQLVLPSSLISTHKFSMQKSRKTATK